MTLCTPHYPFRRWQRCIDRLPETTGVRRRISEEGRLWLAVVYRPYLKDHRTYINNFMGRDIFFPRCLRRGIPPHRGVR